jgi:hypothetical protein
MAVASVKTGVLEFYPRVFLGVFFSVYILAFSMFFKTLLEGSGTKLKVEWPLFLLVGTLFSFYANNYEISLWHLCSIYSVGSLLIAASFREKNLFMRVLLATLGLMTYDTFVFLLVGFSILFVLVESTPDQTPGGSCVSFRAALGFEQGCSWKSSWVSPPETPHC